MTQKLWETKGSKKLLDGNKFDKWFINLIKIGIFLFYLENHLSEGFANINRNMLFDNLIDLEYGSWQVLT